MFWLTFSIVLGNNTLFMYDNLHKTFTGFKAGPSVS